MPSFAERAAIIPGGSMTRSKKGFGVWASHGQGAYVVDMNGRHYLDLMCALGARSLGYRGGYPDSYGGVFSLPDASEVLAAEDVLRHVAPWASHVRFTKTGSEATHAAYRIAKAVTGRARVIAREGAYHGWHEWCYGLERFDPSKDLAYWEGDVAAVFYEPPRFEPVDVARVRYLRDFCTRIGALLVFDDMIWGGRWALGGLAQFSGVTPDLACFGKAIGNGQAVACVVGREALAAHGEMASGTYSGDSVGLEAVCETLRVYTTEPVIETLWDRGRELHQAWQAQVPAAFATLSDPAPLMAIRYANPEHKPAFQRAMLAKGIVVYPDWLMTMYAHTSAHMVQVAEAAAEVAREFA